MTRVAILLLSTLPLGLALGAAEAADRGVSWRIGRSDFLRYERTKVTGSGAKEKHSGETIVTLHGHDLTEGQYSPAAPVIDDLKHMLALRLTHAGSLACPVKFDWRPLQTTKLRVKGEVRITESGPRIVKLEGRYTFKSRGKASREDRWWFDDGSATTEVEFDQKGGVVQRARVEIRYTREDTKKSGPQAIRKAHGVYELRLKQFTRARPKDFQDKVNVAIDRGVKHVRRLQQDDGSFKPHGGYKVGTTALAVLTMTACGVSREDPQVSKALDWLFQQEPVKTYDLATSLLAVDRAYTPAKELKAIAGGHDVEKRVRDLPAKRMAWVRRTAKALEKNASSPGSWGYPPGGRSLLRFDTSNTQYAVLGLRAATYMGYEVREQTWLGVIRHFGVVLERKGPKGTVSLVRRGQAVPDESQAHLLNLRKVPRVAGFRYSTLQSHSHVDSALNCAAISCLLIARHQLRVMRSRKWNAKLAAEVDEMIAIGWAWVQANWRVDRHPRHHGGSWYYYFLYSLERAGMLDGVKRVGGNDWYFEGAMQLLARQTPDPEKPEPKETDDAKKVEPKKKDPFKESKDSKKASKDGAWNHKGRDETPPTCFALLFLKRGTTPLSTPITGDKR